MLWIGLGYAGVLALAACGAAGADSNEAAVAEWERRFIQPMKDVINDGDCDERYVAFQNYSGAVAQMELVGRDAEEMFGAYKDAQLFVNKMIEQCEKEAYEACVNDHDFSGIRIFHAGIARQLEILGSELTANLNQDLFEKCMTFELETEFGVEYGTPPTRIHFLTKAKIPLEHAGTLQRMAVWSGEQMPTVEASMVNPDPYCTYSITSASGEAPMRAVELEIHPDTVGPNRLKEAESRLHAVIADERAMADSIATEKRQGTAVNPDVVKARNARAKDLEARREAERKNLHETFAKYGNKEFNKPRQIDLLLHPGQVSVNVFIRCRMGGQANMDAGIWYPQAFGPAFQDDYDPASGNIKVVFNEDDIEGGELVATKEFEFEDPRGMKVEMELQLWHRPQPLGAPIAAARARRHTHIIALER